MSLTLTAIDKPGRTYTVTVSKDATVQEFLDEVKNEMEKRGIAYNPGFVRHEGRTLDLEKRLSEYTLIDPSKRFIITEKLSGGKRRKTRGRKTRGRKTRGRKTRGRKTRGRKTRRNY